MSSAENEQVGGEGAMEDDDGIEDNIGMNLLQEQFTIETMNSKDTGAEIIQVQCKFRYRSLRLKSWNSTEECIDTMLVHI